MPDHRFDESLPAFVQALRKCLGENEIESGWILRDAIGKLAFVAPVPLETAVEQRLVTFLTDLAPYVEEGRFVLDATKPGVDYILETSVSLSVPVKGLKVRLLDRRIVDADWLTPPAPGWQPPTARFVFASVKGGVGRSTALAVAASKLASKGRNVLVLDLDLEAPGIGSVLLSRKERPRFGILDYLVESGLTPLLDDFLQDMVGASGFGAQRGLLDVSPACGIACDENPQNFLAKLARAYLEQPNEEGNPQTLLRRIQVMVDRLCSLKKYDAVLIDARAGLNETTAAAILGLGADVLLFAVDTPQSFDSYRYLAATLAAFPRVTGPDDWLMRLKWVHAKASSNEEKQKAFRDRVFDLCAEGLYISDEFPLDAREAPHFAWPVLFNQQFLEFDPLGQPDQLHDPVHDATFSELLQGIEERMELPDV